MASLIPKHHVKDDLCTTRPPYREGRKQKAVKVYTVVQESCYLLVQGVPMVGASHELVKLFALHGAIEEYRILDEYPAEEYTEVYLIKFKKILSARFAKRKLDDYSFFGGTLHVCYAPEYETVKEVREKLQDRRKVIAAKTRKKDIQIPMHKEDEADNHEDIFSQVSKCQNTTTLISKSAEQAENSCTKQEDVPTPMHWASKPFKENMEHILLQIPPKAGPSAAVRGPTVYQPKLEYARVPTAQATFPVNYDARIPPRFKENKQNSEILFGKSTSHSSLHSTTGNSQSISENLVICSDTSSAIFQNFSKDSIPVLLQKDSEEQASKDARENSKTAIYSASGSKGKTNIAPVIHEFKKYGPIPRFIPRQAQKARGKTESQKPSPAEELLNSELQKNALQLGEHQGPTRPGEKVEPFSALGLLAVNSVKESMKEIRKRLSKFSDNVHLPLKKSKEDETKKN